MFKGSSPLEVIVAKRRFAYGRTGERLSSIASPFSTHLRTKEPLDIPVEHFLSMLRFESKGKLEDLGFEIKSPNCTLVKTNWEGEKKSEYCLTFDRIDSGSFYYDDGEDSSYIEAIEIILKDLSEAN